MTILVEMNEMVLQRRKLPIGSKWPDPDELEWRSVTPEMIEFRWQADLLKEKEREGLELERKLKLDLKLAGSQKGSRGRDMEYRANKGVGRKCG